MFWKVFRKCVEKLCVVLGFFFWIILCFGIGREGEGFFMKKRYFGFRSCIVVLYRSFFLFSFWVWGRLGI